MTDYTVYRLTAKDRLKYGLIGLGLSAVVSRSMYRSMGMFLITGPVLGILLPVFMKPSLKKKRLELLQDQFKESIGILNGYLSAGYSVENAFDAARLQLEKLFGRKADITKEYSHICDLLRLNRPVGDTLTDFAMRSGLKDIKNFAEVFTIAGKTGGNLRDIIDRSTAVIREKMAVAEEICNMTAGKRYEQKIMNLIPFMIILYLDVGSPGFLDVMYESILGRIIMTLSLIAIGAAYVISQKILDIRV